MTFLINILLGSANQDNLHLNNLEDINPEYLALTNDNYLIFSEDVEKLYELYARPIKFHYF